MPGTDLRDRITRWRERADGFFAFLDDVRPLIPGPRDSFVVYIVPNDEVRDALRDALDRKYSTVVLCWPRRHGKTVATALIIVWRFLTRRLQTIAIVANSEKQTVDTAFRLVRSILEKTPYTRQLVESGAITIGVDKIEYPALGNIVQGFPSAPAALYGRKLSVAQVSELHAARTDAVYQVLASSTIDSEDGLVLVDSTAGAMNSPLFALREIARAGTDPTLYFSHIEYRDLADAIARGPAWIKPERLRSRAAQMLPAEFAQQHLNQWSSGSNALFPADIIARCKAKYPLDPKAIASGAAFVVGGGLDRAYGFSLHGDATVTTAVLKVLEGEDEHLYVLASDSIKFSSAAGIKRAFTRYHRDFGMSRATLEYVNAQDVGAWAAEQPFQSETVHPTPERQAAAFTALYNAASEGRLHIHPSFAKLLDEMAIVEYRLEATGTKTTPKFGAPGKRQHDDHVYSLAWAVYSLRDLELNPYELTGIHCEATGPAVPLCILNGGQIVPPCADACRSMQSVDNLYKKYQDRDKLGQLSIHEFFAYKVKNAGSHTIRR
jgi:hypothetical protein